VWTESLNYYHLCYELRRWGISATKTRFQETLEMKVIDPNSVLQSFQNPVLNERNTVPATMQGSLTERSHPAPLHQRQSTVQLTTRVSASISPPKVKRHSPLLIMENLKI
jgi:hypothetical protein